MEEYRISQAPRSTNWCETYAVLFNEAFVHQARHLEFHLTPAVDVLRRHASASRSALQVQSILVPPFRNALFPFPSSSCRVTTIPRRTWFIDLTELRGSCEGLFTQLLAIVSARLLAFVDLSLGFVLCSGGGGTSKKIIAKRVLCRSYDCTCISVWTSCRALCGNHVFGKNERRPYAKSTRNCPQERPGRMESGSRVRVGLRNH